MPTSALPSPVAPRYSQALNLLLLLFAAALPTNANALTNFMSLALLLWLALNHAWVRTHLSWVLRQPLVWLALGLWLWMLISLSWGQAPLSDALYWFKKHRKLLFVPLLGLALLLPQARRYALYGLLLGSSANLLLSLLSAALGYAPWGLMGGPGNWTPLTTHSFHNFFLAITTFALLCYAFMGQSKTSIKVIAVGYALVAMFDAFFLVQGRTGHVSMILLMLLFIGTMVVRYRAYAFVLLLIPIAAAFSSISHVSQRFHMAAEEIKQFQHGQKETSVGLRLAFYQGSWGLIKDKPILGHGAGSFGFAFTQKYGLLAGERAVNPHNDFFLFTVELGIVGFVALVALFILLFKACYRLWLSQPVVGVISGGISLAFFVSTLANSFIRDFMTGFFFMLLLAWVVAHEYSLHNET